MHITSGSSFRIVFLSLVCNDSQAADRQGASSGLIRSEGDVLLNGAQSCLLQGVGENCVFHPGEYYPTWTLESPLDSLKDVLQICTGWQSIPRPAGM